MGCDGKECGVVLGLAHNGLIVKDMQRSLDFYMDALGFECYYKAELPAGNGMKKLSFLRCGTCEIELAQLPMDEEKSEGVVDHIALIVDDVDAMMRRLSKKGVKFETEKPEDLLMLFERRVKYIFLHGPDGERIELTEDVFSDLVKERYNFS
jgi:catechol 2,3-dioxygenase-like lactoylglutathione lyase family enzyme